MLASSYFKIRRTAKDDWFDAILNADTELFVDPFLVFREKRGFWRTAHDEIIQHFDVAFRLIAEGALNPQSLSYQKALHLLTFREPKELGLGYTAKGTAGAGGGRGYALGIAAAIGNAIRRGLEHPRHFEELGILNEGIGADRISDITCTILKRRLIQYTQDVAGRHQISLQGHTLFASGFDDERLRWTADGSSYGFEYNYYAELAQATLPTGGIYQYDYPATTPTGIPSCTSQPSACQLPYVSMNSPSGGTDERAVLRRVTARRVYPNGSTLEGRTCYSPLYSTSGPYTITVTHLDSSATDCVTGIVSTETHVFNGNPFASYWVSPPGVWYESASVGKENQMSWNTAGGSALKTVNSTWQVDSSNNYQDATECQRLITLSGTPTSATAGSFTLYDQYFNVSNLYEYDFGSAPAQTSTCPASPPSGWTRHTQTLYIADGVYNEPSNSSCSGTTCNHMRSLTTEEDVYNASVQAGKTTYGYDASALATAPGTPAGYVAPAHSKRGNRTSKNAFYSSASDVTTTYAYDTLGNVVTITDPLTYQTTISYADNCSAGPGGTLDAFPTTVTNALNQKVTIEYDCYIGKQTNFQDANSVSTSYSYDILNTSTADPFDRLVLAKRAVGKTGIETHTTFEYPNLTTVTTEQDENTPDDHAIVSTVNYDGLSVRSNLSGRSPPVSASP